MLLAILLLNIYSLWKEHTFAGHPGRDGQLFSRHCLCNCHHCLASMYLLWKTELITFISKLTVTEIRSALLLAFITAVVYP
ncbi:hypothetical protein [Ktedonobacter racemifer]|uniref:hypothetical protein n=1 Tax=Ktedonobacter racemifer TaxID=363277 RepID=UPI0006965261|nr:hypothetical protein [Ktedonobacter racemifer]